MLLDRIQCIAYITNTKQFRYGNKLSTVALLVPSWIRSLPECLCRPRLESGGQYRAGLRISRHTFVHSQCMPRTPAISQK
jgi:hypothetical protein